MTSPPFRIETLGKQHDRASFACGEEALDTYFRTQVTQDIRRRVANCFVIVDVSQDAVAGYYTLSAASLAFGDLPADVARRLPRYPALPVVRIGRLAVNQRFQRRGLGELMLLDAANRVSGDSSAAFALIVEAKNEHAVAFYRRYGFRAVAGRPRMLFLPLATARRALTDGSP